MTHDDDLTPVERAAYSALPREAQPPPALEDAVVRSLRARGVLRSRRDTRGPLLLAAAAALVCAGFAAGRFRPHPAPYGARYLLLLLDDTTASAAEEPLRVAEYRGWARGLLHPGTIARGEKLEEGGRLLAARGAGIAVTETAAADAAGALRGLFVIEARGWEEALAVARTCPHLAHGGRVVLRRAAGG